MKNANNSQMSKVEPQDVPLAFAGFFADFRLVLIIKVFLIKKACNLI